MNGKVYMHRIRGQKCLICQRGCACMLSHSKIEFEWGDISAERVGRRGVKTEIEASRRFWSEVYSCIVHLQIQICIYINRCNIIIVVEGNQVVVIASLSHQMFRHQNIHWICSFRRIHFRNDTANRTVPANCRVSITKCNADASSIAMPNWAICWQIHSIECWACWRQLPAEPVCVRCL